MNNMVLTFEQVDGKLLMTIELVKPEHPNPTMIRSNDGNTETIEFVDPPLTINTDKGGLDLSKYKPFPKGYIPTKEIKAVRVFDPNNHIKIGEIGTIIPDQSAYPKFIFGENEIMYSAIEFLAPLDPSDHPDYKPEEVGVNNAEQIVGWFEDRICETLQPQDRHGLIDQINALVQYELNKAKR